MPIDIACLFLAGMEAKSYTILLVDEFQRINEISEQKIKDGLEKTLYALNKMKKLYSFSPEIVLSSEIMKSDEYRKILSQIKAKGIDFRNSRQNYEDYVVNEIACTEYMKQKGIEAKIGPSKEKEYDKLMEGVMKFFYVIDSYALGTKEPCSVVHYVPEHRGTGQRIMIDEPISKIEAKIMLGPEEAERYFLKLASASGYVLGLRYLNNEEISQLKGMKLKKIARDLTIENIVKPYMEVIL